MKQLAIRITDELHKALKLAAVERGTNVTAIIIEAVKSFGIGSSPLYDPACAVQHVKGGINKEIAGPLLQVRSNG